MQKIKRILPLLLALAIMLLAASCGAENGDDGGDVGGAVTPAPTPTPTPGGTGQEQTPATLEALLPGTATAEPVPDREFLTLTIHYRAGNNTIFNPDWPAWQQASALTGIVFDAQHINPIATEDIVEFNLQAANLFPAHIYGGQNISHLFMEFGMQGAFVPLNDLIAQYAPNFQRILDEDPVIRNFITAPDGNIYHLPTIPDGLIEGGRAWFVRQDWLDLLGLDHPDTIEEFEAMLFAFRDEIPALIGVESTVPYIDGNWHNVMRLANFWGARSFGQDANAIRIAPREDRDEVFHTWTDDDFLFALENISRWYGEGLIDRQFITRGAPARQELLSTNQGGVFYDFPVSSAAFNDTLADVIPGFNLVAMRPPANIHGQRISEHERLPVQPHGWAISHTNPDPAATMRMMDFFYSDHGRTLLSFGAEGITFEYDASGRPVFLPHVFEQTDRPTPTDYIRFEMGALRFMGYKQLFEYERQLATGEALRAFEINEGGPYSVRQLPPLAFSAEELAIVNDIRPGLNDFLNESMQSFIVGDWEAIRPAWPAFVAQADALGRREYVAAYQSAFLRAIGR